MKDILTSVGIVAATLLALTSFLPLAHLNLKQEAAAYVTYGCAHQSNIVHWKDMGMSSTYLTNVQLEIAMWNDLPSTLQILKVTTGEQIRIQTANNGNNGAPGQTDFNNMGPPCLNGFINAPATITLNTFYLDSFENEKKQNTIGHELGHAVGLNHCPLATTYCEQTLMIFDNRSYITYHIFAPVLDEIRAAQALYGITSSTSECFEYNLNGDVIYTGTCTSTFAALPMTEKVLTSGTNNRAFASKSSTSQALPSVGTVLMTAKVKPTVIVRHSVGIHTNTNPTDLTSRFMTIRLEPTGWKAVTSDTSGTSWILTLCSCPASTSTTYWMEIIVENGDKFAAYVYQDDGGGATPPTWISTKQFTPTNGGLPWTSSVYYGSGVWQGGSGSTLANWDVSQFSDRLKSYQ